MAFQSFFIISIKSFIPSTTLYLMSSAPNHSLSYIGVFRISLVINFYLITFMKNILELLTSIRISSIHLVISTTAISIFFLLCTCKTSIKSCFDSFISFHFSIIYSDFTIVVIAYKSICILLFSCINPSPFTSTILS